MINQGHIQFFISSLKKIQFNRMAIGGSDLVSEMESKLRDSIASLYDTSVGSVQNQANFISVKYSKIQILSTG